MAVSASLPDGLQKCLLSLEHHPVRRHSFEIGARADFHLKKVSGFVQKT
jgi:hypothetical protein